ncbi:MAG: hypothetical protein JXR95_00845 [Deltaproteobacteria bacterium]|nr:hypothetical protein [Deltaproteobacteria bacterium]
MKRNSLVSIGYSTKIGTKDAVREMIKQVTNSSENFQNPAWAMAFCGGNHNPMLFFDTIKKYFGNIPVVGGSAPGAISNTKVGYTGYECSLTVFSPSIEAPYIISERQLPENEHETGKKLGIRMDKYARVTADTPALLLYGYSKNTREKQLLNSGSKLLEGIQKYIGKPDIPPIIGGGLVSDPQYSPPVIFDGYEVCTDTAVCLVFSENIKISTETTHGCISGSGFFEITKCQNGIIYELENRPALDVLLQRGFNEKTVILGLAKTNGRTNGTPEDYTVMNRKLINLNTIDSSIQLSEKDCEEGDWIQILSRHKRNLLESTRYSSMKLMESLGENNILFTMYLDDVGRTSKITGTDFEEAYLVQGAVKSKSPLVGFYTGSNIGVEKCGSFVQACTGVLAAFSLNIPGSR